MKTPRLMTVGAAVWLLAGAASAKGSAVRRVVVFADRAEVTRVLDVGCEADRAEAAFVGLPASIDIRTLRGMVSSKASVIGVTSRIHAKDADRDDAAAALKKELLATRDAMDGVTAEQNGINQRSRALQAYEDYLRTVVDEEMRSTKPDVKTWAQALDTVRDLRLVAASRSSELDTKLRELQRQGQVLERRLQALGGANAADTVDATVAVDCNGEAKVEVGLAYVVPGATWKPDYDLRFRPNSQDKTGAGKADLVVSAVVRQSTGEDWENVQLALSTSKPRLGADAPYPAPLFVSGHESQKGKVLVQATERRQELRGGDVSASPRPEQAELQDQGQSFSLTLPRPVTVKADGRPYWMPVDQVTASAEAKLVAIPKLRPYVYQVAELKNAASYPLLGGVLHTYRRGAFVGDSELSYKGPGERIEASLGVDEELKVERAPIEEKDKSGSFISNQKLNRAYRITVTNNASTIQVVEVRENVPVSKIDDVSVEVLKEGTTAGYDLDRLQGFVTWKLSLTPGEKKSLDLRFKISVPSDWQVGG